MDSNYEEIMEYLIDSNAMYATGINDNGEVVYRFNLDILEVVMPELHKVVLEEIDQDLMELYKMGLVDIDYDENLNARFKVSEKGQEYLRSGVLPKGEVEQYGRRK